MPFSPASAPGPRFLRQTGIRSPGQLARDLATMIPAMMTGRGFTLGLRSAGHLRPDLSIPTLMARVPTDGLAPIANLFDRTAGGRGFRYTVTRSRMRDHRGGRLSYDEHDGTDMVCPVGTPLVAAAPGIVVAVRDRWLRGGLTACVDHGEGVVTQYTHLSAMVAELGQPVARGETIALSGRTGVDMTLSYPWVAPHVHFMVWVRGRPVDPFLAPGEARVAGTWADGNRPRTTDRWASEPGPRATDVDGRALEDIAARCLDPGIAREIEDAPDDAARVAIVEDSLHHDREAWPAGIDPGRLRPTGDPDRIRLTLPLPGDRYRGVRFADTWFTTP